MRKSATPSNKASKRPAGAVITTAQQLSEQYPRLEEKREAVQKELARLRAQLRDWPVASQDGYDPLVDEYGKNAALVEQYEQHLAEIAQAMRAAQHGAYGMCERCGQPIGAERLQIMPETRWCVRCRGLIEHEAAGRMMS